MKKTEFSCNNFIKSYQFYAFPLGILATDNIAYENWLLGRFIGVTLGEVLQYDEEAYDDWEIVSGKFHKYLIKDDFDILIQNIINEKNVFHLWGINERYLPYTSAYQRFDFMHDLLVTGYDGFDKVTIVNYDNNKTLSEKVISINDLKNSFTAETHGRSFKILFDKAIPMDGQKVLDSIKNYLYPSNRFELKYYNEILNPKNEMLVGIPAIKKFIKMFEKNVDLPSNINGICLLNEQKRSIMNSLIYLKKNKLIKSDICNEYSKIVTFSEQIKLKYIKYLIVKDKKNVDQIVSIMNKMINDEIKILNDLF